MSPDAITTFKQHFSGEIILPGDINYDQLSKSFIAKGSPAIIVKPQTAKDVAQAILFAKDNRLTLSVRSGGHSGAGFSTNTGGIVIDLSLLNSIEVTDADKHLVRIGGGAKWGEVANTLMQHDLAISSGDTKSVGVGGLTLGGGIGWMVRKYGLAIDSLVSAEIVTADGSILHVGELEHPDLFWAVRGGTGNVGIVTQFEFTAHSVTTVYSGTILYKRENIASFLTSWRDYMRTADESLTTTLNIMPSFGGSEPSIMLTLCCDGSEATGKTIVETLKKFGTVTNEMVKEKKYAEVLEEAHPPEGIKIIVRNAFVEEFTDEVVDSIDTAIKNNPNMIVQIRGLGGAMKRVPVDATAFAHRNSEVMILCPSFVPPTATDVQVIEAIKPWQAIAKYGNGAYANFLSTAADEDIQLIYPESTYNRLRTIKKQYDPENIFNQNYNIKP